MTERMDFADGKYTVINENGKLTALRHGELWGRDLTGDNLIYWMLMDALKLKAERGTLAAKLKEVDGRIDDLLATCHRLALELECLLLDTKDSASVSRWWDSAMAALDEWHKVKDSVSARPVPAEPVNARLLEALKRAKDSLVAFKFVPGDANRWEESDEENLAAVNSAIADARQERLLQYMHDAGLEIDRVMAEPTPRAVRLTGPDVHLATVYTCESGDSIATRKKYLCSREEMEAQKEKSK